MYETMEFVFRYLLKEPDVAVPVIPVFGGVEARESVQDRLLLHSEFEASLDYLRPRLKKKNRANQQK